MRAIGSVVSNTPVHRLRKSLCFLIYISKNIKYFGTRVQNQLKFLHLITADQLLTPRVDFSPLLVICAKLNGWTYNPKTHDVCIDQNSWFDRLQPSDNSDHNLMSFHRNALSYVAAVQMRDCREVVVVSEKELFVNPLQA